MVNNKVPWFIQSDGQQPDQRTFSQDCYKSMSPRSQTSLLLTASSGTVWTSASLIQRPSTHSSPASTEQGTTDSMGFSSRTYSHQAAKFGLICSNHWTCYVCLDVASTTAVQWKGKSLMPITCAEISFFKLQIALIFVNNFNCEVKRNMSVFSRHICSLMKCQWTGRTYM